MISKNQIKFIKSLSYKKNRRKYNKVVLEGFRLIEEAIKSNLELEYICLTKEINLKIKNNKLFKNQKINIITDKECQLISNTKNSQGILALASINRYSNNIIQNIKNENIIILDGVKDPGNLGTILRNCAWYGIKSIILTENSIDPFNSKCIRSGMGAHFYLENIIKDNSQNIIDYLLKNHFTIIIADLNGQNLDNININNKWALVLGSEAHGVNPIYHNFSKVTIDKFGDIESLNVSVASGILLNELLHNKK
tara:strand:+ start:116 stop:874 length:759 start_codon:yes stop_codon:yes gene_type:complete